MDGRGRRGRKNRRVQTGETTQNRFEDPALAMMRAELDYLGQRPASMGSMPRKRFRRPMVSFLRRATRRNQEILNEPPRETPLHGRQPFAGISVTGGNSTRTWPPPGRTTQKLSVTEDLRREIAQSILEADETPDADEPAIGQFSTAAPSPIKGETVEEIMEELHALEDEIICLPATNAPHRVPTRAERAYVPQSHGNGFHYGWEISVGILASSLESDVKKRAKIGMRVAHIATSRSGFPGDPAFDVLWIRDDDSNFLSGVEFVTHGELFAKMNDQYPEVGVRPICIVNTVAGFLCVVWIKDAKYLHANISPETPYPRWRVESDSLDKAAGRLQTLSTGGWRAIWATYKASIDELTIILVKDGHDEMSAVYVWERHGGIGSWDPVGDFHKYNKFCVPICVEITRLDALAGGQGERYTTVIVGAVDHDLRTLEDPGQNWTYDTDKGTGIGTPRYVARTGAWGNRPYAIARMPPTPSLDPRFVVVRTHSSYRIQAQFRCVDDPVDNPLDEEIVNNISSKVGAVMLYSPAAALSISIRDDSGWRLRRAYTLAPRAYEDTYPESKFRVASISKMLTSFTIFASLDWLLGTAGLAPGLALKPFAETEWPFPPSTGGPGEYPPELLDLTVADLLVHQGGWDQEDFFPGQESIDIVEAVAASGEMKGWQTPGGAGLLPMLRTDMFRYVLDAEAFQNNADVAAFLKDQTGYRQLYAPGQAPPAYSGFHYDMLGAVVEILSGSGVTQPRDNWALYVDAVNTRLLDLTGAKNTIPGRQSRYFCSGEEVVYPCADYVQQTNVPVEQFRKTVMFSPPPADYDPDDPLSEWYPKDEALPVDIGRAPEYAGWPYATIYDYEAVLPSGGWVSTAPDLCLVLDVLDRSKQLFSDSTILTITDTANITQSELDNPGWRFTPGGMNFVDADNVGYGGISRGSRAELTFRISDTRRIVVCSNATFGHAFNLAQYLAKSVTGL